MEIAAMAAVWTLSLLAVAALLILQLALVFGRSRGVQLGLMLAATLATGWWLRGRVAFPEAGPADWSAVRSVPSDACVKCHADHYDSWRRTYHRTMTRDAT